MKYFKKFQAIRNTTCKLFFSPRKLAELSSRKEYIFYKYNYMQCHENQIPHESCCNILFRHLCCEPYPYKYDYEIDCNKQNDAIRILCNNYRMIFEFHHMIIKPTVHPSIEVLIRDGETHSGPKTGCASLSALRQSQVACQAHRTRSLISLTKEENDFVRTDLRLTPEYKNRTSKFVFDQVSIMQNEDNTTNNNNAVITNLYNSITYSPMNASVFNIQDNNSSLNSLKFSINNARVHPCNEI